MLLGGTDLTNCLRTRPRRRCGRCGRYLPDVATGDHPPGYPICRLRPWPFKAFLNAVEAAAGAFDDPRALPSVAALKSACTHTGVRQAVPLVMGRPRELLPTLPPHQRPDGVPRIAPSACVYAGARYIVARGLSPSVRNDRIRRSTGVLCTVLHVDFGESPLSASRRIERKVGSDSSVETILSRANLGGTHLGRTNVSRANLSGADLSDASLMEVDLREPTLEWPT